MYPSTEGRQGPAGGNPLFEAFTDPGPVALPQDSGIARTRCKVGHEMPNASWVWEMRRGYPFPSQIRGAGAETQKKTILLLSGCGIERLSLAISYAFRAIFVSLFAFSRYPG